MATDLLTEEVMRLLELADRVVTWTTQDTLKKSAAGYAALVAARQEYYKARIDMLASHGHQLTSLQTGGCTCDWRDPEHKISPSCLYHYAARLQPENHRIPWNCPTYYDGCNCENTTRPPSGP